MGAHLDDIRTDTQYDGGLPGLIAQILIALLFVAGVILGVYGITHTTVRPATTTVWTGPSPTWQSPDEPYTTVPR